MSDFRGSAEEVKEIIDTDLSEDQIEPYLRAANNLVTNVMASDTDYNAATLKLIELWLAAHFVAVRDPRVAAEGIGGISLTYEGKTGQGLASSRYGQQAMALDFKGRLVKVSSMKGNVTVRSFPAWTSAEQFDDC